MRLFRQLSDATASGFGPSAITIGNFDGVHAGHRALLDRTLALARARSLKPSALTFHPHPTAIVAPDRTPRLLSTIEARAALLAAAGIAQTLVLPFDQLLADLEPSEFFQRILRRDLGAQAIIVGDNFRFGRRQSGDVNTLRELGFGLGVTIEIVPAVRRRGFTVSSSQIRALLAAGRAGLAARLLGRPYSLAGHVVKGAGRGSRETVPTLNLELPSLDDADRALPLDGVYITRTHDHEAPRSWPSITNIGYRPTYNGAHLTIETFLLEPLTGDTPSRISVDFLHRLRPERRFPSPEDLRAQILSDVARAHSWFRRAARWINHPTTTPPPPLPASPQTPA
ncbi:MAG: riboflavin biosynthesis protein RibF [Bryobacteraceae bacterium]|nr:riboflavin biosynthesis protein RibF [Bryobacteraceae bacterium]